MALSFFRKKEKSEPAKPATADGAGGGGAAGGVGAAEGGDGGNGAGKGKGDSFAPDPRKAARWFDRARTVAETRNYDYAIDCYLGGLKLDPENQAKHEELYDVAVKRKVGGGKPAGFGETLTSGGKTALDRLIHAETLWAKNPVDVTLTIKFMRRAVEADQAYPNINLAELVYWIGERALELAQGGKQKVSVKQYLELRDHFRATEVYDKAAEACRLALAQNPDDPQLQFDLKELEAERMMKESNLGKDDYRANVKDNEEQRRKDLEDRISKTDAQMDEVTTKRREELKAAPDDLEKMVKLVDLLQEKASDASEAEAIKLLTAAFGKTSQYRFKVRIGDLKMRQLTRKLKAAKVAADAKPNDGDLKSKFQDALRNSLAFELEEYTERVNNYPTDLRLKFELGRRLHAHKRYDDAITMFQQASQEPKNRAPSMHFLGQCFSAKGWYDDAIQTLRRGIESYQLTDDKLALGMRYNLMDALEQQARKSRNIDLAREAQTVASQIVQADINHRDIRQRVENLRKLIDELQKK